MARNKLEIPYAFRVLSRRTGPATVKIIGLSSGAYSGPSSPVKYCQLWYNGDTTPRVTVAEYIIVPETHDKKSAFALWIYHIKLISCDLSFTTGGGKNQSLDCEYSVGMPKIKRLHQHTLRDQLS